MISVVGPVGAGKTTLLQRLCFGFSLGSAPTLACSVYHTDSLPGVTLWDTPGDDRFCWVADSAVKRADVIVYCEPANSQLTYERNYKELNQTAQVVYVVTKGDLPLEANPTHKVLLTSATTGEGVDLLKETLRKLTKNKQEPPREPLRETKETEREKRRSC